MMVASFTQATVPIILAKPSLLLIWTFSNLRAAAIIKVIAGTEFCMADAKVGGV